VVYVVLCGIARCCCVIQWACVAKYGVVMKRAANFLVHVTTPLQTVTKLADDSYYFATGGGTKTKVCAYTCANVLACACMLARASMRVARSLSTCAYHITGPTPSPHILDQVARHDEPGLYVPSQ
jgi:hypothetical protein